MFVLHGTSKNRSSTKYIWLCYGLCLRISEWGPVLIFYCSSSALAFASEIVGLNLLLDIVYRTCMQKIVLVV
jgi:hypothetical protein